MTVDSKMSLSTVALLLSCFGVSLGYVYVDLNGNDTWTVANANGSIKIAATVPGQVSLDLLKAGVIADPYYRFNDEYQVWVAMDNWTYYRKFDWSQSADNVWLVCHGLDTVGNVSLNGKLLGTTNNQHRKYYFDIKDVVKASDNEITISFMSAATYSINEANSYPYNVPGGGGYFHANRNFVRKCQSDFGWDWGPAFVPTGIWRDIGIVGYKTAFIDHSVPQIIPDGNGGFNVTVNVYIQTSGPGVDNNGSVNVELAGVQSHQAYMPTAAGEMMVTVDLGTYKKGQVDLWWPNGYGNATLYNMTTTVASDRGELHSMTQRVGFRKLELVQKALPDGEDGLSFYISVNDVPIFAKGSNWIPADAFTARVTYDDLYIQLKAAIISHQNIVRVWGGGIYQVADFYDICDELGIMVWQEFMFSDALYPRDKDFLETVAGEIQYQVRRLAHHPSLAIWSGNNENQGSAQGDPRYLIDYSVLYDNTVHATLIKYDRSRPYWPSSPSNGALVDDPSRDLYIQRWGISSDPHYGDVHRPDNETRFGDFVYLSQAVQAICIQAESEHYRRIKDDKGAYTMGAMYWQLNDIWQAQSWSSIEYGGRWKLLHYSVRRFFAPLLVSAYQMDNVVAVYVSSDLMSPVKGELKIDVWTWKGEISHSFTTEVKFDPLGAGQVWTNSVEKITQGKKPSEVVLALSLTETGQSLPSATNVFYFTGFTDVALQKANINVSSVAQSRANEATFTIKSDVMAPFVYLQTNVVGYFSDNGFLLVPGRPQEMTFTAWKPFKVDDFQKSLEIRSVADTYKM